MTDLLAPPTLRHAEIRGWVLGLRDLRRDGLDLAVRGRAGSPGVRSGDRCFALATGPGRWLVGMADAHGPGDDAADAACAVVAHLRTRAPGAIRRGNELPAVLGEANAFVRQALRGRLVSVVLLHVDAPRHAVRAVVAGGVAPLVAARGGEVVPIAERGPALGLVDAARWRSSGPVRLAPGHLLLAVTDGVPDRARDDGTTFGAERVTAVLRDHRAEPLRAVVRTLLEATDAFAPGDPADRTALALRIR